MSICLALHTGRFMLSLYQMTSPDNNSTAMLISEQIRHSSDSCLSFWYNMNYRSEQITPRLVLLSLKVLIDFMFSVECVHNVLCRIVFNVNCRITDLALDSFHAVFLVPAVIRGACECFWK